MHIKIIMGVTKWCGWLSSKKTHFYYSWFSGVKTAKEEIYEGVDYCGLVNTSHKLFFLHTFESLRNEGSVGSYVIMNIAPIVPGDITCLDIGYKYNSRMFLLFISNEGSGSTEPGYPYLSHLS